MFRLWSVAAFRGQLLGLMAGGIFNFWTGFLRTVPRMMVWDADNLRCA
jgi:hypothetical protein